MHAAIQNTFSEKRTPAITLVGCTGRMGGMLCRKWSEVGFAVTGMECLPGHDVDAAALAGADIVVLAVPVSTLCETMERVAPHMHPGQLLMDITSVKMLPMLVMQEFHTGPVIGSHPMFGPMPKQEELRTVLVAGHACEDAHMRMAEELFTALGAAVSWSTAQEHDHGVAFAQSLNFAMSTAFFSTIARHPECLPFLTPSFKRHMEAARKHLTVDRAMFCEFTAHNPCFDDAVNAYRATLEEALSNLDGLSAEAAIWFDDNKKPVEPVADAKEAPVSAQPRNAA